MIKIERILLVSLTASVFLCAASNTEEEKIFHQHPALVAFDVISAIYGVIYGSYQCGRFIKECIAYKQRRLILKGNSEEELCFAPLNELCKMFLEEESANELEGLYNCAVPIGESEIEQFRYRYRVLGQYNMYQFPVFMKVIQQWPEYPQRVLLIKYLMDNSKKFYSYFDQLQGFKKGEFRKFIDNEIKRLDLDMERDLLFRHRNNPDPVEFLKDDTSSTKQEVTLQKVNVRELLYQSN